MKHASTNTFAASLILAIMAGCGQAPSDTQSTIARPQPASDVASDVAIDAANDAVSREAGQLTVISEAQVATVGAELDAGGSLSGGLINRLEVGRQSELPLRQMVPTATASTPSRLRKTQTAQLLMPDRAWSIPPVTNTENYTDFDDNPVKQVAVEPVSTFSIDVDTAAYSNMRRMIAGEGRLPPEDAVRIEEMINYFAYSYPQPESASQPFSITTELAPTPWNHQRQLLRIGLQGYEPPAEQRPAANLVFLVDVSGSMQAPDKLPVVKNALRLLVNALSADDQIALVAYAGAAGVVLEPTSGASKSTIMKAIAGLQAGGSTHGSAGIKLAYELAREHFIKDGINRVLIASDGDMNVGTVSIDALVALIEQQRKSGIQLSTLGFGTGNYNYALMEQLADNGNGTASYIDSIKEAHKVLVSELQSTLLTIAKDVKIQIEFNPEVVAEYRLVGYENRMLATEDFKNDKVDAGDIGAGHRVTAFYELTLHGSNASRIDPLRYQSDAGAGASASPTGAGNDKLPMSSELAYVKLRYKRPDESRSRQVEHVIKRDSLAREFNNASEDFRFASAVAGFGQYLRGGKYNDNAQLGDMIGILRNSRGADLHGYRGEFISLVELASALSAGGGNAGAVMSGDGG